MPLEHSPVNQFSSVIKSGCWVVLYTNAQETLGAFKACERRLMQANSYTPYNRELMGSFHRGLHFQQKNLRGLLIGHAEKHWHRV